MRPENDLRLARYVRKIQRKAGQIDQVCRDRSLNALFDLLEELGEEKEKAQFRINDIRFPR